MYKNKVIEFYYTLEIIYVKMNHIICTLFCLRKQHRENKNLRIRFFKEAFKQKPI